MDLRQAHDAARAIAAAALGHDPGPMATAESSSHHVYVGSDVVVKISDAAGHSRLDREIAFASTCPMASRLRCSTAVSTDSKRTTFATRATPAFREHLPAWGCPA